MNKILLYGAMLCAFPAISQTVIFQDNFEAGASNWTLNGGTGTNQWIVNSTYPSSFAPVIPDTPSQPAGITNGPNSAYLHINNTLTCMFFGACNATFDAASASNRTVQSTNPIVTTGFNTVTLSFYYLAAGDATEAYGTLEYTTDNVTWTPTGTHYVGVSTWTLTTVALPAWDNQAQLKFRFRWFNTDSEIGDDPAFAIDEVKVTGVAAAAAPVLTTGTITPSSWCFNTAQNLTVPFTVTGTVNAGNTYTAQLSDASGSFATPLAIGTLASAANGTLSISATVPAGTAAGTGYRIRVTASDPAATGTDNGSNITINALPVVAATGTPTNGVMCAGSSVAILASGASSYTWSPATGLSSTNQATVTATPAATTTYTVTGTANGCTANATFTVTVNPLPPVTVNANPADGIMCVGENIVLTASGATVYTWSPATGLSTVTGAVTTATPTVTTQYTVTGTNANGCVNTANFTVTFTTCLGIDENDAAAAFVLYPNPTSGLVTIDWNGSDVSSTVRLMDYSGRLLEEITLQNNAFSLDAYPAGTYLVQVVTNGHGSVKRVTKK